MSTIAPLEPGHFYHIYNRGNNSENIFIAERNYSYFLMLYTKHIEPVAETFAYCLLRNHFHACVRIRDVRPGRFSNDDRQPLTVSEADLIARPDDQEKTCQVSSPSQAFSNFFNAYTKSINKLYGRTGSLFEKPFRRIEITSANYCMAVVRYIHLNPQKHGFVEDFRDWPYSSYHALMSDRPTPLQRAQVLEWFNGRLTFDEVHLTLADERGMAELIGDDED
jgi:REP element-mobilizing transposase RayT